MPVPPKPLKTRIEGQVDHHASQRWPQLEEVTIRWRGSNGYLTGHLPDNQTIPLARIGYLGHPTNWAFAIYQVSTDTYCSTANPPAPPHKPSTAPPPSTSPTPPTTHRNQTDPRRNYAALH